MKAISTLTAIVVLIGVSLTMAVLAALWMSGLILGTTSYERLDIISVYFTKAVEKPVSHIPQGVDPNFPQHICVVKRVINGDHFICVPSHINSSIESYRFRLADVKAPSKSTDQSYQTYLVLKELIESKIVYIDIDDVNKIDKNNYWYSTVYVRYNSTHLLNVNKYLLDNGYLLLNDIDNEFAPSNWSLYIYYPISTFPEKDDLFIIGTGINVYDKGRVGYSKTIIDSNTVALIFADKEKSYIRAYLVKNSEQIIRLGKIPSESYEKAFKRMLGIANNKTHVLYVWTSGKYRYGGYRRPGIFRIVPINEPENYKEYIVDRNYVYSPSVIFLKNKWIIIYGQPVESEEGGKTIYFYRIVFRIIDPKDPYNYSEYSYNLSRGENYEVIQKVGIVITKKPIVLEEQGDIYVPVRKYDEDSGYDLSLIKFNVLNYEISELIIDNEAGDQGSDPGTYDYMSYFNIYKNIDFAFTNNRYFIIIYTNETETENGPTVLYYKIIDLLSSKIIKEGVITSTENDNYNFYPVCICNDNKCYVFWRISGNYYYKVIDVLTGDTVAEHTIGQISVGYLKAISPRGDDSILITYTMKYKNNTVNKDYGDIYYTAINTTNNYIVPATYPIATTELDDNYALPIYADSSKLLVINDRIDRTTNAQYGPVYITVIKSLKTKPVKITEIEVGKELKNFMDLVIVVKNSGSTSLTISEIFIDNKPLSSYDNAVLMTNLPITLNPGDRTEIVIRIELRNGFVHGRTISIELVSSRGLKVSTFANIP